MLDDTDLVLKQADVGEDGDEAEINVNLFDGTRQENGVPLGTGSFFRIGMIRVCLCARLWSTRTAAG